MMLYAVRDLKVGKYGSPFIMDNDMTATRSFLLSLSDVTHPSVMTAFPMDFELFQVGDFDFVTGQVTPLSEGPRFVASAGSCQDEFTAMQKKYIQLAESISMKKASDSIKAKLSSFSDAFLNELSEKLDFNEYRIALDTFNVNLELSGLIDKEENTNE